MRLSLGAFLFLVVMSVARAEPTVTTVKSSVDCKTPECFYNQAAKVIGEKADKCDVGLSEATECCMGSDIGPKCSEKIFPGKVSASGGAGMPTAFGISDDASGGGLYGAGMAGFGGDTAGGDGGLHGAAVKGDKLLDRGTLAHYKYAGVCKRMAEYCEKSCSADADKASAGKCGEIKSRVTKAKEGGDGYKEAAGKNDSGKSGAAGGGGGAGAGAGTQQPSTAQGGQGGGGMGDMMKALQGAMQPQNQNQQQQQQFQSQTCEQNPALAGCKAKKPESDSWNKKSESSEFQEQSKTGGGDNFNVGDTTDGMKSQGFSGNGGEKPVGSPSTSAGIPNGGGSIPGGGGGGGAAASGGGASGYAGAQKNVTDVLHGAGGGGYSAMNANMQLQNGGGGGFSGYGGGGSADFKPGMDLRQFLPGGKNDPTRKIAGGASSFEIQPQTVNIWSRISERFRARCTAGLLRDCGP